MDGMSTTVEPSVPESSLAIAVAVVSVCGSAERGQASEAGAVRVEHWNSC